MYFGVWLWARGWVPLAGMGFPSLRFLIFYLEMELAPCVFEVFRISGLPVPVRERERERDYLKVIYLSRRYLCQII